MPISPAEWVLRHPGKFGTITVRAYKDGTRRYEQRGGNQGTVDAAGVSLETYIHALYALALQRGAGRILIIGCASGSLATMLTRAGKDVTLVDIDAAAFKLAKRYFGLPDGIACHVSDGVRFLQKSRFRFDTVIVDAFIGESIPRHFGDESYYDAARRCVKRTGMLLANVCLHGRNDPLADEIARGFEARGWRVRLLDEPGEARNAIVLAGEVSGLRGPRLILPPEVGVRKLARKVARMRFRPIRTSKN